MAPTTSSTTSTTKKTSTMKLLLLVTSFLATTTGTNALQTVSPQKPISRRSSPSQLSYSVAADLPNSRTPSFIEDNMRQAQQQQQAQQKQSSLPNMMEISSLQDFKRLVTDEANKLTVVRFHAPFCRACKAMAPQLDRFARQHPEINFVNIAWNKQDPGATNLIRSLRVNKVPHGQVYHPTMGLIEEANMGKKYFGDVAKIVESYQTGECELGDDVNEYSQTYESPYVTLNAAGKRVVL